jgi:hypothetical protein
MPLSAPSPSGYRLQSVMRLIAIDSVQCIEAQPQINSSEEKHRWEAQTQSLSS